MTPTQRAAAERLAEFESLPRKLLDIACRVRVNECLFHDDEFVDDASHTLKEALALLRELAAEPVQEPVAAELPAPQLLVESAQGFVEGWTRSQVRSAINLALLKRRYAAPQQPMRCPEDGGACGAGGYCRPEPVQRKPLTREQIDTVWSSLGSFTDRESDYRIFARAIERAHGITGEQK